ncbi:MAG TPA: flagellin [Terriglobales bacterium]|nr:flagellin [Terriglobales bacterium]
MALSILNNIASLAAQNQLNITNNNLQNTLFRLSSGQRINSGADDAAGLAIANGLQANITALTQSSQNATNGYGMLQVADGALSQVTSLLNRAVTLATESATGTVSDSQRTALDAEFSSIKSEIDNIGQKTTYNGAAVFAGISANNNQVTTNVTNPAGLASAITGDMKIKYWDTTLATPAYTTQTFGASTGDATVGDLIDDINNSNTGLVATLDKTGNVVVTDTRGRGNSTNPLADGGSTIKINGDGSADTLAHTSNSGNLNVYLSDSTVAGSTTISVAMGSLDSNNLNGISLSNNNLSTAGSAQTALTNINNAIAQIAALRGNIGASSNQLTAATNVMNNQVQNLTSAEDGIMSADIPKEVANLTKYQILEQTGMSALAQANQMQQNVLKLLQ